MSQVGKLFIDNMDAYLGYGVYIADGGTADLVSVAQFKSINATDWPDEDGEEPDLTAPVLDSKEFVMDFFISDVEKAALFYGCLSDKAYHDFYFRFIERTYRLRLVDTDSFASCQSLGRISMTFSDDFPSVPEESPYGTAVVRSLGYAVDGVDFAQFGILPLEGTKDAISKAAAVKENLKISASNQPGSLYDNESVRYKAKDVTLHLFIHGTDFWKKWNAFFTALLKPGLRTLTASDNKQYQCYYTDCNIVEFAGSVQDVWCKFDVTLRFTNSRPDQQ